MSGIATAIAATAVIGAGTAIYLDDGGGGASGQYGGQQSVRSSSTAMPRPPEYDAIFGEFMERYFGQTVDDRSIAERQETRSALQSHKKNLASYKAQGLPQSTIDQQQKLVDRLQAEYDTFSFGETPYEKELATFLKEKEEAQKKYLEQITGLKEPYLGAVETAMGTHRGLLDEIVTKRMAGEAVGPYAGDIDKLLAERAGVSFGGADPMQFITGSQQRLLSDLLGAQETGLSNIALTSLGRSEAEKEPAGLRYLLEKDLAGQELGMFTPSNADTLSYLQELRGMWEPMEMMRYTAQPSTSTTTTGLPLQQGPSYLDQLQQVMNMGTGAANWASLLKSPTPAPMNLPNVPQSTFQIPTSLIQ